MDQFNIERLRCDDGSLLDSEEIVIIRDSLLNLSKLSEAAAVIEFSRMQSPAYVTNAIIAHYIGYVKAKKVNNTKGTNTKGTNTKANNTEVASTEGRRDTISIISDSSYFDGGVTGNLFGEDE